MRPCYYKPKLLTGTLADFNVGAKIRQLTEAQFDEFKALVLAGTNHRQAHEWLQAHGVELSVSCLFDARRKIRQARADQNTKDALATALAQGGDLDDSLKLMVTLITNIAMAAQTIDDIKAQYVVLGCARELIGIKKTELRKQENKDRVRLKERELGQRVRRLDLLEERISQARADVEEIRSTAGGTVCPAEGDLEMTPRTAKSSSLEGRAQSRPSDLTSATRTAESSLEGRAELGLSREGSRPCPLLAEALTGRRSVAACLPIAGSHFGFVSDFGFQVSGFRFRDSASLIGVHSRSFAVARAIPTSPTTDSRLRTATETATRDHSG